MHLHPLGTNVPLKGDIPVSETVLRKVQVQIYLMSAASKVFNVEEDIVMGMANDPPWDNPQTDFEFWTHYISPKLRKVWIDLSVESRLCIMILAHKAEVIIDELASELLAVT